MEIFYFYYNRSTHAWYDCKIEAWAEENNTYDTDGKKICSYKQLEKLSIHISKHPFGKGDRKEFHCCRLDHEFGKDSCMGHHAKNRKDFVKDRIENHLYPMNQTDYRTFQRFRRVMLNLHRRYPPVNYTEILMKDAPVSRIIW